MSLCCSATCNPIRVCNSEMWESKEVWPLLLFIFTHSDPIVRVSFSVRAISYPFDPLVCLFRRMTWCMWRRSRTICLSLAFVTVSLHLLLALVTLSIPHLPCDAPLPPEMSFRVLAHNANASARDGGHGEPPTDAIQGDSSSQDCRRGAKVNVQRLPYKRLTRKGDERATENNTESNANQMERWESDMLKLKALFDHPLYNTPRPAAPEDDWLLKVKPKTKPSQRSSQMWSAL